MVLKPLFDELDFGLEDIPLEADKHKWSLPDELAENFSKYTKMHISDKDWATNMENYPPPANVDAVPTMDNNFRKLLKDEGQNTAIDVDQELASLQKKVEEIMGPLGQVWAECAKFKRGEIDRVGQLGMAST